MPEVEIQFASDEEYEVLRDVRNRHGVQWRGMLLQGARQVEGYDLRQALLQLDPVTLDSEDLHAGSLSKKSDSAEQRSQCAGQDREQVATHAQASTSFGHPVSGETPQEENGPGTPTEPPANYVAEESARDESEASR